MLGYEMFITIKTLWQKGKSKSEISKMTGHDRKTVRKIIKQIEKGIIHPVKEPHPCKLGPHKENILEWLEKDLSGVRIHQNLLACGVDVAYSTVRDFLCEIKKGNNINIRFHTEPGEEAQVDFGYAGITQDDFGKKRKTWIFNMRLSYSRLDYYEKVYDQKVETFIKCHIKAFKYFGGVPEYVKIDNLKAAILEANFYEPEYQSLYQAFAEYYNFKSIPCRVREPQEKGKVESGIKYVKNNFFRGRNFKSEKELNERLCSWLENTCNSRVHGTTRKVPRELFNEKEKDKLLKLPADDFLMPQVGTRKVFHDCHVYINYNYYSVPYEYVGKEVELKVCDNFVKIFYAYKQIAMHAKLLGKGEFSTQESHYPKYKNYLSTEYQESYQMKMREIGSHAEQMFLFIFKQNKYLWNRPVCGILSLRKKYPDEIIDQSCKRALAYSVCNYKKIKSICEKGLYSLPLENTEEGLRI